MRFSSNCAWITALLALAACRPDPGSPTPAPVVCDSESFLADDGQCATHTTCAPGEFVASEGTPDRDRVCSPCEVGAFSATSNAATCEPWSVCPIGYVEQLAGTAVGDRECTPTDPWHAPLDFDVAHIAWTGERLLVSGSVFDVSTYEGSVVAVDVANGDPAWSTSIPDAYAPVTCVRTDGGVLVAATGTSAIDAFVQQVLILDLEADGTTVGSQILASATRDYVGDLLEVDDGVLVAGYGLGASISDSTGFVRHLRDDGTASWELVVPNASVRRLAPAPEGGFFLAARVGDGNDHAVARYDGSPPERTWSTPFQQGELIADVHALDDGDVLVGGRLLDGGGYLHRLGADGSITWTFHVSPTGSEVRAIAVDEGGRILLAGWTSVPLAGPVQEGLDGFVAVLDMDGTPLDLMQVPLVYFMVAGAGDWVYVVDEENTARALLVP